MEYLLSYSLYLSISLKFSIIKEIFKNRTVNHRVQAQLILCSLHEVTRVRIVQTWQPIGYGRQMGGEGLVRPKGWCPGD